MSDEVEPLVQALIEAIGAKVSDLYDMVYKRQPGQHYSVIVDFNGDDTRTFVRMEAHDMGDEPCPPFVGELGYQYYHDMRLLCPNADQPGIVA